MSKEKISSQEMVDLVAAKLSVSKRVAEEFLKSLFVEIEEALIQGESVKIKNLGTFKMQWNEPRKSVNVQTGEVFTIEGYNKVTFTPDSDLKDAVNEPYSHLEAVELDDDISTFSNTEKPAPETPENLRNLTEQASEIRDILSEIKALSAITNEEPKAEISVPTPEKVEIPDYPMILIDEELENPQTNETPEIETIAEIIASDFEQETETIDYQPTSNIEVEIQEEKVEEVSNSYIPESITYEQHEEIIPPTNNTSMEPTELTDKVSEPFIVGKKKKRKGWKVLFWLVLCIALLVGGLYAYYGSSSCFACWVQYDLLSESNRAKLNEYKSTFTGWFSFGKKEEAVKPSADSTKIVSTIPTDSIVTDSASLVTDQPTEIAVDSFELAFKNRRKNYEYIGEEIISEGMRLTDMSKKYYGKKDFWVYIYEANRDNIVHPDRITPGTIVKVPQVDAKLIDRKNPRCLEKAYELHDLYIGKN